MNTLQLDSIHANVKGFCKDITLADLREITMYVCYNSTDLNYKLSPLTKEFILQMFGEKLWKDNQDDEIKKPEFFCKVSRNDQELIRLVRIGLLQEHFWRSEKASDFTELKTAVKDLEKKVDLKPDGYKLPSEDKTILTEILKEHQAMLEYQLEDKRSVKAAGGQELVDEKERHLKFIKKFWKLKIF